MDPSNPPEYEFLYNWVDYFFKDTELMKINNRVQIDSISDVSKIHKVIWPKHTDPGKRFSVWMLCCMGGVATRADKSMFKLHQINNVEYYCP